MWSTATASMPSRRAVSRPLAKGAVGDHRRNFEAEPALPVFAASRAQYGFKVATSAGNQDDDVLHDVIEKKCIDAALI